MERIPIPTTNNPMAPSKVPPIPNRLVNNGVKVDTAPKAIKGRVVSNPNNELDKPVCTRISSIKGPTLAKAGRRLMAMNSMPAINKIFVEFLWPLDLDIGIAYFEVLVQ